MKYFQSAKKQIEGYETLKARFDQDQDGYLDPQELERGAKILGLHLQSSQNKEIERGEPKPSVKMIFQHRRGHPFVISNMKEKNLVSKMNWVSIMKLFGGPALALVGLAKFISSMA